MKIVGDIMRYLILVIMLVGAVANAMSHIELKSIQDHPAEYTYACAEKMVIDPRGGIKRADAINVCSCLVTYIVNHNEMPSKLWTRECASDIKAGR